MAQDLLDRRLYPLDPHSAPPKEGATVDEKRDLLRLKIDALKIVADALERGASGEELWERCLGLLAKHLTTKKLDRYLMLDHLHYDSEMVRKWKPELGSPHSGGLSCLLSALEEFRFELESRMMSGTAEKLEGLVKRDHQTGLPRLKVNSYFGVSHERRPALNQALDHFDNARLHRISIEENQLRELTTALRTSFPDELGYLPVRKLPYPFEYPEQLLTKAIQPASNVFRQDGDIWRIEFHGQKLPPMKDTAGLRYIHFLIQNRGKERSAIDIFERVTGKPAEDKENARNTVSNGITRALNRINKASPTLWRHLFNNIDKGHELKYSSDLNWKT